MSGDKRPSSNSEPGGTLSRPRLLRRLKAALHLGHVLLIAPPGYGKTTLVRALLAERPYTHYVLLTPADADLSYFQTRLQPLLQPNVTLVIDDLHLVADESEVLGWLYNLLGNVGPRLC